MLSAIEHVNLAHAMSAMSHKIRLEIVSILGQREASIREIGEQIETSKSNLSLHLGVLWEAGIIRFRRDGKQVFYRISDRRVLLVMDGAMAMIGR